MHVKWSRSLDGIVHNNNQHRAVSRSSSPDLPGPLVVLPDSADSCTAESDSNSGCSLSATAAAEQSDLQGRSKTLKRKTAKQVELMKAANATAANTIATANTSSAASSAYPPPLLNGGSVGSRSYKDSNNNNDHNHDDQVATTAEIEGFLAAGSRSRGGQNDDEADEEHLLALTGNGNNAQASTSQSHEMSHSRSTSKYLQQNQPMSPTSSRALLGSRDSYSSSPPASSSISSNRITSKGALSTLIGLFRFRPNDEYPSPPSAHFHPSKLPPSKSAANHSHHHRTSAASASQFRRRMSLERLNSRERHDQSLSGGLVATVTSTSTNSSKNYPSSQMNSGGGGSLRAGRRASSLQSLTDVLNSFNRSELLSPPSGRTRPRPLVGPASSPSFVIGDNKVTSSSSVAPDATSKRRVSSWENDPPKRHLVKFVNDEPQMLLCSALKHDKGARSYQHYHYQPPKGILRVRNPQHSSSLDSAYNSNYSEIVSFRTASSASPSANSSSSSSSSSTAAANSSSNSSSHFHSSASLKKNVHFAQPLLTTYAICDGS